MTVPVAFKVKERKKGRKIERKKKERKNVNIVLFHMLLGFDFEQSP
jgi:hypothetical protein